MGIFYNHVDPEVEDKADEEYTEWFNRVIKSVKVTKPFNFEHTNSALTQVKFK